MIGFENENYKEDIDHFVENILKPVESQLKTKSYVSLRCAPFEPQHCTPLMWAGAGMAKEQVKYLKNKGHLLKTNKMNCYIHRGILSDTKLIENLSILRFSEKYRDLTKIIALSPEYKRLNVRKKEMVLRKQFDINDLIRRYDTDENPPCSFITGIASLEKLRKIREKCQKPK